MLSGIGTFEMALFGILALMLFGAKLPEVARNLGGTYRGLKRSVDEFKREFQAVETYEPQRKPWNSSQDTDPPPESGTTAPKFTPPPE